MSNVKYYYDPETLSYRKITTDKKTKVRYTLGFIFASALFGFFMVLIGSQYFESPKEKILNSYERLVFPIKLFFRLIW